MELTYIIVIISVVFLLLVILGLAIVNYSFDEMIEQYKKYSNIPVGSTPIEFFNLINSIHFGNNIRVKYKENILCDSFSGNGVLTLCSKYAQDNNMAGLAICAHELGHAFQFKNEPNRMKSHTQKIRLSRFFSLLISPTIIAGISMFILSELYVGIGLIAFGILSLTIALIAKFSTLKLEKDASSKALELLSTYAYFTDDELQVAKKFLNSAKQTYIADILRIMLKWTMLVKK